MEDNALTVGSLGNATGPSCKHGHPSDLHTECWGCELSLSIDDGSHTCYVIAGPAFNCTQTAVDSDILMQVIAFFLPCFPLLTSLLH
jgi:hypothetical protein